MILQKQARRSAAWAIPLLYALVATAAGLIFPRIEARIWPHLASAASLSTATAIYSAIASGMIALTGIVFSLAFVMVQFSATAYSPRLVFWIARDPVMSHALGIFTATFLYAIAALAALDRSGSQRAPLISAWLVVGMLIASVAMFISLIQRIGLLQVNRMLTFTGDLGRKVIREVYRPLRETEERASCEWPHSTPLQVVAHKGPPRTVQAVDTEALVALAKSIDGLIQVNVAVGDPVREFIPLLRVFGTRTPISETKLRSAIELGRQRAFLQDAGYAIRLLVDIAIRALSPAVNDPTTAVQALDQIEDLLFRLGRCRLNIGEYRDGDGELRLLMPFPTWEDFLRLAMDEISFYGSASVQVTRKIAVVLEQLRADLPDERRAAIRHWEQRLRTIVKRTYNSDEERVEAGTADRQGLGPSTSKGECLATTS